MGLFSTTLGDLLNTFAPTGPTIFAFGPEAFEAYKALDERKYLFCRKPNCIDDIYNISEEEWKRLFPCQPYSLKPVFNALLELDVDTMDATAFNDPIAILDEFDIQASAAVLIALVCNNDWGEEYIQLLEDADLPEIGWHA